jgi:endonuclease/exonuclease/phosphatase family metal-dependent hydrolase
VVRVATFNVLHGRSVTDGRVDAGRFRDAVASLDADVLGLQEVDRDQERSHRLDLTAVAADALGATDARFAPAISGTPGRAWTPAFGDARRPGPAYGVALVSRLQVRAWHVIALTGLPVRAPVRIGPGRWIVARDEPRIALVGELALPGGRALSVTTTHLSFVPGWNAVQLRRVVRTLGELPGPHLLTGDLNMPGALPRTLARWRCLAAEPTFPAAEPTMQLDHVLALGVDAAVRAVRTPLLPLSDHRPVVVDLDLTG